MIIKTIDQISGFRIIMRFISIPPFSKRNQSHTTTMVPLISTEKYRNIETWFTIFIHVRSIQIIRCGTSPSRIFPCCLFKFIFTISGLCINNWICSAISGNRITPVRHSICIHLLLSRANATISSSGNSGRNCMYAHCITAFITGRPDQFRIPMFLSYPIIICIRVRTVAGTV